MRHSRSILRSRTLRNAAIGALFSIAISNPAAAATYNLSVDRDSWLKEGNPSENHGSDTELSAKSVGGEDMRAIYRFDLSAVPANAVISSAVVSLWVSGKDDSGNALDLHRVTANWTEPGVRWNNTASDFDSVVAASFTAPNDDEFVNIDITALMQSWVCGDFDNDGFMVHSNSSTEAKFTSKEWSTSSERPKLTVITSSGSGGCSGGANHFSISHDGNGVNCQAEPVSITAHNAADDVVSGYTGVASLSTSTSHGDWSLITGAGTLINSGNGAGTYAFHSSDAGTAVLGLRNTFAETTNINVTDGSAVEAASEDADLVYASTGFNFLADASKNAIATQIAGKGSNVAVGIQTLELEAVRTNDDTGACEAALTGVITVDLAFECENPATCSTRQVAINGSNIAGNSNAAVVSYTSANLDFGDDTDTTATFTFSYPDTGQLQLHARRSLTPSGETLLGASNSFVVRPFALHVSAAGNPAASSPAGPVFTSAGTNFSATVSAVLWDAADDADGNGIADNHDDTLPNNNVDLSNNAVAPNFGQESSVESVSLTAALNQPSGGSDPGLAGLTTISAFVTGSGSSSAVRYDEVGIIEMAATIADGDYLGIGAPATSTILGRSGYTGRFNPARYAVTASNIVPACAATFSYSRQPFNGTFTIEAQNGAAGGHQKTVNYRGGFVTLDPQSELDLINDQTGASYDAQLMAFVQDFDTGLTGEASFSLQLRWDMAQQAPADSTARITGVSDEVSVLAGAPVSIGSTTIRYGRIAISGAFGSELVNLALPMRAEYYVDANTGFVNNVDDVCSTAVTLSFSNFTDNLASGETCVLDSGSPGNSGAGCAAIAPVTMRYSEPPIGGDFNLYLQAPGAGNNGSTLTTADVPAWLEYDWNSSTAGNEDPAGTAVFGIFRGQDRRIYTRELY